MSQEFHLFDQELLQALDGELSARDAERVQSHLSACWACRARKQEIEATISEFIRFQRATFDGQIPPPEGPRALLKAQLAQLGAAPSRHRFRRIRGISQRLGWAAMVLAVMAPLTYLTLSISRQSAAPPVAVTVPNPSLTPGATVLLSGREICGQTSVKNKFVPVTLQRRVFAEYGIGLAKPGAYEVDYLITPALGEQMIFVIFGQSHGVPRFGMRR